MVERLNGANAFQEVMTAEVERFRRGGDSGFRSGASRSDVMEGARAYLGLNGDSVQQGDHLVFLEAANQFLAEREWKDVAVGVSTKQETTYSPEGQSKSQDTWKAYLLRRAPSTNGS